MCAGDIRWFAGYIKVRAQSDALPNWESQLKSLIAVLLFVLHGLAIAQSSAYNGVSVKKGLDAYDRIYVTKNASDDDFREGTMLIAYVSGMLAVHRANNLTAVLLFAANNPESAGAARPKTSEVEVMRLKTMLVFTPLLSLPEALPPKQLVAILRKFLNEHPERWSQSAVSLITDALVGAFPSK